MLLHNQRPCQEHHAGLNRDNSDGSEKKIIHGQAGDRVTIERQKRATVALGKAARNTETTEIVRFLCRGAEVLVYFFFAFIIMVYFFSPFFFLLRP